MVRLLIPAALLLSLATAASASIAPRRDQPRIEGSAYRPSTGPGIGRQAERIGDRIEEGRERGQLSRREARGLRREARLIRGLHARYARGGLSEPERRELQARIDYLNGTVSARRSDGLPPRGRRR